MKNLNSFANVERALEAERERQIGLLERGDRVAQVTLLFNAGTGQVRAAPLQGGEPRLPVLSRSGPSAAGLGVRLDRGAAREVARAARGSPRAPGTGVRPPAYDARVLTSEIALAEYFESVVGAGVEPKTAANWVMGDVMASFNETGGFPVAAPRVSPRCRRSCATGTVSHQAAKRVYAELAQTPTASEPKAVAERLGLVQVSDQGALAGWVDEVLAAHPGRGGTLQGRGGQADGVLRRAGDEAEPRQGRSEGRAAGAGGEAEVQRQ